MSLNAQALRLLAEKGLTASDIAELAEALEVRKDPTAAERMRRYRAKNAVTRNVTVVTQEQPPNEYISNPPVFDVSDETSAVSDFADEVVEAWNREIVGTPLPSARNLTPDRRKHLKARVKVHGREAVFAAIQGMCRSDFHSGKSGQWTHGNLGWLLKNDENFVKMLERKPAEQAAPSGKQWTPEERAAYLAKIANREAGSTGPPPAANREPTAFGTPIGQIAQRIAGQA